VVDTATINLTLTGQQLQADYLGGGGSGIPIDGWVADANTWTYATAQTFTIPGDHTAIYKKGVKLKWTNASGVNPRYGTVKINSTYSAPNTTVTIITNTDFVIANDAISLNNYSLVENPAGFPNSFAFTPSITNFTVGNATVNADYSIIRGVLWFSIYILFGNTTSIAAGGCVLTLPTPMAEAKSTILYPIGRIGYRDTGTGSFMGTLNASTATTAQLVVENASGTYTTLAAISNTVPMSWTTNDEINIVASYPL
jgi:hypothetical protein